MASTTNKPEYISAAALIVNKSNSTSIGMEDWPEDIGLQERRIASLQVCFSETHKLLPAIQEDFDISDSTLTGEEQPLSRHMDMWRAMYKVAETLTRPGVLHYVSFLGPEHLAGRKTRDYLIPIRDRILYGLTEIEQQSRNMEGRFKGILETGPEVAAEVAQTERYRRWKRSYAVLLALVRVLYHALEKILRWILDKMDSMTPAIAKLRNERAEKAAAEENAEEDAEL